MSGTGFIEKVRSAIRRHEMARPGDRVLVGVSGGPDSVALLYALWALSRELQVSLHVGHLNHMLRGAAADEDAAYVRDIAGRLGVPVTIESRDAATHARENRMSVELAAREIRYDFYFRVAKAVGAARVALGHHAGDQAETVLLRLIRGTGTTGLGGIPPVRPLAAGGDVDSAPVIIRPLIDATRQEIEGYCRENGLNPRVDASNLTSVYARNRVRHELVPLLERHYNPRIIQSIARTAELVREDDSFISGEVRRRMERIVRERSRWCVALAIEPLLAEPPAIQRRVVRQAVALVARGAEDVEFEHVEMVLELARGGLVGASADLPRGVRARKTCRWPDDGFRPGARPEPELVLDLEFAPGPEPGPEPGSMPDSGWGFEPGPGSLRGEDRCGGAQGISPPERFERRLIVPGTTSVPELGVVVEAEALEAGEARGIAADAVRRPGVGEAYFDLDGLGPEDLIVRTRREGDRIAPFGMDGHKKLKELLIDEKIPRNMRDRIPVIVAGREVLWVAGVRRSDLARVTPATRRVLHLVVRHSGQDRARGGGGRVG